MRALRTAPNHSLFTILFIAIAKAACSPFDCMVIDPAAGTSVMRDSPDVPCTLDDNTLYIGGTNLAKVAEDLNLPYSARVLIGYFALSCVTAAIVIIATTLRCGRSKLHTDERFMRTNGTLYLRYDKGAYYWEVLIMLRKFALALITRFLSRDQEAQIGCCAVVLGAALVLQRYVKPFDSNALDTLEEHTLVACVAIVALGTCAYLGLPPAAVTALYFTLMAASAVVIARDMRAIYNEGGDEEDGNAAPPDGIGAGKTLHNNAAGIGTGKKVLV